jgi:hypothetical protein
MDTRGRTQCVLGPAKPAGVDPDFARLHTSYWFPAQPRIVDAPKQPRRSAPERRSLILPEHGISNCLGIPQMPHERTETSVSFEKLRRHQHSKNSFTANQAEDDSEKNRGNTKSD